MFSLSRAFLASSLLVSGAFAAPVDNSNLAATCGVFALIGSGFDNSVNFTLTAFPPTDTSATSAGVPLIINGLNGVETMMVVCLQRARLDT